MSALDVIILDDEASMRFMLTEVLESHGLRVQAYSDGREALAALDDARCVLTDLAMPAMDGFAVLAAVRERRPELPVIVLTAHGSERAAVQAMKSGAYDYLQKPVDIDELRLAVGRAIEAHELRSARASVEVERAIGRPLVGESPAFARLLDDARRVARLSSPVLVRGETGTGKELVASLLHASGPRKSAPFVRFNCAAIPDGLAESELFGHEKGAFTGATQRHAGYFTRAHGGTLVLDEVAELSLSVQAKLLRALQSGEVQPVGRARVETVDARVIACTHRDLREEVSAGRFREDLYYRLAVIELRVPPLRERRGDIPRLVEAFRQRFVREFSLDTDPRMAPELIDALCQRSWPGNVRELENAVARMLAFCAGEALGLDALERLSSDDGPAKSAKHSGDDRASDEPTLPLRERLASFERGEIERALASCAGNQSEAARALGITRASLIDKCKRYGLLPSKPRPAR